METYIIDELTLRGIKQLIGIANVERAALHPEDKQGN